MTEFAKKMSDIEKKFCSFSTEDIQCLHNHSIGSKLTLCLGAGVTAYYVGNWNQLLDEILSIVFWNKTQERLNGMKLSGMRKYLKKVTGLPKELSTLEKGEYLILAADDSVGLDKDWDTRKKDYWREILFAGQTRDAILRIMARKMKCNISEAYDNLAIDFVTRMMKKK